MKHILILTFLFVISFSREGYAQSKKKQSSANKPIEKSKPLDKNELENRKKKLQQEIQQFNKELEETRKDKRASMRGLLLLNQKIMKRQALINNINSQLEYTNSEISENVSNINQLNARLKTLRDNYARMILYAYKNRNQSSMLTFLGKSDDFNQSVRRVEYLKRIADARKVQITQINTTTDELNTAVKKLEVIKEDQSKLLESKEKEKQIFNEEKDEKEKVVAQLQTKEKDLKQQIRKKQEDANKLNLAIKRVIEEEVRKAREAAIANAKKKKKELEKSEKQKKDNNTSSPAIVKEEHKKIEKANQEIAEAESAKGSTEVFALSAENQKLSSGFENNRNRLPWPVASGVVVSSYGEHEHPVLKGIKIKNNGIDIKTKSNSDSRAVFDGEVTGVISIPGAGKAVIVRHGEYLSVYSNLLATSVSKGEKVKARQMIGTIANGDSGAGELHFEIWKGQTLQNPQVWLGNK
jgi:septal ring factor EnvC (AmiA/AmiB activator)